MKQLPIEEIKALIALNFKDISSICASYIRFNGCEYPVAYEFKDGKIVAYIDTPEGAELELTFKIQITIEEISIKQCT
jgi:hypothetical protein